MSFGELLFLLILALLVFGPRKLPEIARTVGKIMTDLRRASNEFRYTLEEEIRNIEVSEHPTPRLEAVPPQVDGAVSRHDDAVVAAAPPPPLRASDPAEPPEAIAAQTASVPHA